MRGVSACEHHSCVQQYVRECVCVCAHVNFQLMILDYHDLDTCSLCCAELGAYTGSVYCLKSFFMLFLGDYTGLVHCLTSFSCRFGRFK